MPTHQRDVECRLGIEHCILAPESGVVDAGSTIAPAPAGSVAFAVSDHEGPMWSCTDGALLGFGGELIKAIVFGQLANPALGSHVHAFVPPSPFRKSTPHAAVPFTLVNMISVPMHPQRLSQCSVNWSVSRPALTAAFFKAVNCELLIGQFGTVVLSSSLMAAA